MTWTKLGDEFADECWTLTDAAFRLHAEGLLWSNRMLTDCRLAKDDMTRWAHHLEAADELVNAGFWEDRQDHFQIIHHAGYQPTAASVRRVSLARKQAANSRWGNCGGSNSHSNKQCNLHSDSHSEVHSECNLHSNEQCMGVGSGRVGPGEVTNYVSVGAEKNGEDYTRAFEPPGVDPDGFPLDIR